MILYFSGTGNSLLVAQRLKEKLQDDIVSLNDVLKYSTSYKFTSTKPFVIVCPIYAWRLPFKIEQLIKKVNFKGNNNVYFVATLGANAGNASAYCRNIIQKKQLTYKGFYQIIMPDSYVVAERMVSKEEAKHQIQHVIKDIDILSEIIACEKDIDTPANKSLKNSFLSSVGYWGFHHFMEHSRSFTVLDTCIRCGKCIQGCPTNNIVFHKNSVKYKNDCMFCLSCLHHCPTQALEYKGKIKENGQYVCPDINEIIGGTIKGQRDFKKS